jgi:hypothetical protein
VCRSTLIESAEWKSMMIFLGGGDQVLRGIGKSVLCCAVIVLNEMMRRSTKIKFCMQSENTSCLRAQATDQATESQIYPPVKVQIPPSLPSNQLLTHILR